MINRVLIRLKIVQIIYAYYQNGGKNLDTAEKELFFSLSKAYDLYNYLLLLMVEVTRYANKRLDAAKHKLAPTKEDLAPNTKFVDNRFIAQLEVNKQLNEFASTQKTRVILSRICANRLCRAIYIRSIWQAKLHRTKKTVNCGERFTNASYSIILLLMRCWKTRACIGMMTRR